MPVIATVSDIKMLLYRSETFVDRPASNTISRRPTYPKDIRVDWRDADRMSAACGPYTIPTTSGPIRPAWIHRAERESATLIKYKNDESVRREGVLGT